MQKKQPELPLIKGFLEFLVNISIVTSKAIDLLWQLRVNMLLLAVLYYFYWFSPQGMDVLIGLTEYGALENFRLYWSYIDIFFFAFFQWYISRYLLKVNYVKIETGKTEEPLGTIIINAFQGLLLPNEGLKDTLSFKSNEINEIEDRVERVIRKYIPRGLAVLSILIVATGSFKLAESSLDIDNELMWSRWLKIVSQPFFLTIILIVLSIGILYFTREITRKPLIKRQGLIITLLAILLIVFCTGLISSKTYIKYQHLLYLLSTSYLALAFLMCYMLTIRRNSNKRFTWKLHAFFVVAAIIMVLFYLDFGQ